MTLKGEEQTIKKSAKTNDEVRRDICARSFWVRGQKAFFEVRVLDPNVRRYSDSEDSEAMLFLERT